MEDKTEKPLGEEGIEGDDDILDSIEWASGWLDKARNAVGNEGMAVQENLLNARARIQQLLDWYGNGR